MEAVMEKCETMKAIERFVDAVEGQENLEIIGTNYEGQEGECFVIRNHKLEEGQEGVYIEVSISEIINLLTDSRNISYDSKIEELINIINTKRNHIVLQGVTRIVGYYSRVTAWNKSKIGELRDRAKGDYGTIGYVHEGQSARLKTIDSMGTI